MKDALLFQQILNLPDDLRKQVEQLVSQLSQVKKSRSGKERKPGLAKGEIHMSVDFDEPLVGF